MMQRLLLLTFVCLLSSSSWVLAQEKQPVKETHVHFKGGVVYCDVQTFNQAAYILKVLGGGSPLTIYWQFNVLEKRDYWFNSSVALVRLGRQVIPDLVTKRWVMRDLSAGLIKYTSDVRIAMRFLTEMEDAAVLDVSILNAQSEYVLETKLFMYEDEREEEDWWSSLGNWGEDMGQVNFNVPVASDE